MVSFVLGGTIKNHTAPSMYNADFRKNDHVESLKVLFLESGQGRRKPTEKEKEEII